MRAAGLVSAVDAELGRREYLSRIVGAYFGDNVLRVDKIPRVYDDYLLLGM